MVFTLDNLGSSGSSNNSGSDSHAPSHEAPKKNTSEHQDQSNNNHESSDHKDSGGLFSGFSLDVGHVLGDVWDGVKSFKSEVQSFIGGSSSDSANKLLGNVQIDGKDNTGLQVTKENVTDSQFNDKNFDWSWDSLTNQIDGTDSSAKGSSDKTGSNQTSTKHGGLFSFDYWDKYLTKEQNQQVKQQLEQSSQQFFTTHIKDSLNNVLDGLFGKNGSDAKTFDGKAPNGGKTETTISSDGVNHQGADGSKAHVDGRVAMERDAQGNLAVMDKSTGHMMEVGKNGTQAELTPEGMKISFEGRNLLYDEKAKTLYELGPNGERHVVKAGEGICTEFSDMTHQWTAAQRQARSVVQFNQKNVPQSEQSAPGVLAMHERIRVNDSHGNTLVAYSDGREQLTIKKDGSDKKEINLFIQSGGHDIKVQTEDGHDIYLHFDSHKHRWEANGDTNGEVHVNKDGTLTVAGHKMGTDSQGRLTVANQTIAQDGTVENSDKVQTKVTNGQAQSTVIGANGNGHDATVKTTQDGSTMASNGPKGTTVTNVNDNTHDICQKDDKGHTILKTVDGHLAVQTPDGTVVFDPSNGVIAQLWNGDKFKTNGDLQRSDGTTFHHDGSVDFSDGTHIDPNGRVTQNGEYLGTAGGAGWGEGDRGVEAHITELASQAQALAASAAAKAGSADAGDLAALRSISDQLGSLMGQALSMHDVIAVGQIAPLQGTVSSAIGNVEKQLTEQDKLRQLVGDVPPDLLHKVYDGMGGAVDDKLIAKIASDNGYIPNPDKQQNS